MKLKTWFLSLVYTFTKIESNQQLDQDICWGTRIYDIDKSYVKRFLEISFNECITLCKQEPTCEVATFHLNSSQSLQLCYLFKPNRFGTGYDISWGSWFKGKPSSWCQKQNCTMPEDGKVYTLTNYFGCPMELNGGHICSGNEIIVSTDKQIRFATSQQWYIKPVPTTPNVYQIINYQSQMALDITEPKLRQQIALSISKNQQFSFSFGPLCSLHIHSVSNGTTLSNVGMSGYCLSKVYVQQDLRKDYNYDQQWFFKEVNLTTNDISLHAIMINSTISMPLMQETLKFPEPESSLKIF